MRRGAVAVLAALAGLPGGCAKSPPTLAGGKPVGYWVEAVTGPDAKLRRTAVVKLGNVGPADPAVVPALTAALRDRDARVRREAVLALAKCGAAAGEALAALEELRQRDRDPEVRASAAKAVAKLRGG